MTNPVTLIVMSMTVIAWFQHSLISTLPIPISTEM